MRYQARIKIDLENDDFIQEDGRLDNIAVAIVLREIAKKIHCANPEHGEALAFDLRDRNGNTVGRCDVNKF